MFLIAICDDNPNELTAMVQFINQYQEERHIDCKYIAFSSGLELLAAIENGKRFDLYFLDIVMPGLAGIDVAKEIRCYDKASPILFFTTSPEYAIQSYAVKAMNYILKPITRDKIFQTLDEIREQQFQDHDQYVIVKRSEGLKKIRIRSIVYAEAMGRNVLYHLISGKVIECNESFTSTKTSLMKHEHFLQSHRSYIVNMDYIDRISSHQIEMQTLTTVPIAQGKAKEIKDQYLRYQMEGE